MAWVILANYWRYDAPSVPGIREAYLKFLPAIGSTICLHPALDERGGTDPPTLTTQLKVVALIVLSLCNGTVTVNGVLFLLVSVMAIPVAYGCVFVVFAIPTFFFARRSKEALGSPQSSERCTRRLQDRPRDPLTTPPPRIGNGVASVKTLIPSLKRKRRTWESWSFDRSVL